MAPRTRSRFIQLGVSQFAIVLAGLFTVATVFYALQPFGWEDLFYRDVVMPRMQRSHGFAWGPVTFHCRGETAPTFQGVTSVLPGSQAVEVTFPEREEAPHGVWLIDLPAGKSRTLWNYRDRARTTWSEDGRWLAVADDPIMAPSRCLLLDVNRQAIVDPLEKLSNLPGAMRPSDVHKRMECEIVGWIRHEPTRMALTVVDFFPARGEHWRFDYYFDVATGGLIAAGSR